jgi:hypothetical protein
MQKILDTTKPTWAIQRGTSGIAINLPEKAAPDGWLQGGSAGTAIGRRSHSTMGNIAGALALTPVSLIRQSYKGSFRRTDHRLLMLFPVCSDG